MIDYRQVTAAELAVYEQIPMLVKVNCVMVPEKIRNGLGGINFREVVVPEYIKDLGKYNQPTRYAERFDISNWVFFMAFRDRAPVGGCTVAARTDNVYMLDGRDDLTVLWDLRVAEPFQGQGVGSALFKLAADWSRDNGFRQMKIECQNNNVRACRFYARRGAALGAVNEYAYYNDPEIRDEVQLLWYLDL